MRPQDRRRKLTYFKRHLLEWAAESRDMGFAELAEHLESVSEGIPASDWATYTKGLRR